MTAALAIAARKARGGFYTPAALTSFLVEWALRDSSDRTLEPSCGDGAFLTACAERYKLLGARDLDGLLYGVELDEQEFEKARALVDEADVRHSSFFDVGPSDLPVMDAVVGNPPYVRYHGFTGASRARGLERARSQGVELSNLASSWAHFVVHAAGFLKPTGRLALVLPAELLHTDYAAPVRKWLLATFRSVTIITFDRLTFADAEVDALLLLADPQGPAGLRVVRVRDAEALRQMTLPAEPTAQAKPTAAHATPRWSGTLNPEAFALYEGLLASGGSRLGEFASVDIGVVTGANKFFILEPEKARELRIPERYLVPIVESAGNLSGLTVIPSRAKRLLLVNDEPTSKALLSYLASGIEASVAEGYKCRTRRPWYRVPVPRQRPDLLLPYMNHQSIRLYVNRSRILSTNLVHCVALHPNAPDSRAIAAAALSAAVMLSAEIEGRSYGGGVLKVETKEAEQLLFPALSKDAELCLVSEFASLNRMVRRGDNDEASIVVDQILGLDHALYSEAAESFRRRRLGRKVVGSS